MGRKDCTKKDKAEQHNITRLMIERKIKSNLAIIIKKRKVLKITREYGKQQNSVDIFRPNISI